MNDAPAIEVRGVSHHYGVRAVLDDISLQVGTGELVALMGPNGSGKSTLASAIAGILQPVAGEIRIHGHAPRGSIEDEKAARRLVAYLPTDPWLPTFTTCMEWLLAIGPLYDISHARTVEHAQRLLELFDLGKMKDAPIRSLSTGQKKKIALSGTLITEAKILILDEPFSGGLDPSGILSLKRILGEYRDQRERTILMATPVPELVEELADRVAILRDGAIGAIGTPAELRAYTGRSGAMDEVYEAIVNPHTQSQIESYFAKPLP